MTLPKLPPTTWVRFTTEAPVVPSGATLERYRVEQVRAAKGAPLAEVKVGAPLFRVTSTAELPPGAGSLAGVTQHLGYTRGAERPDLLTTEPPGPNAVCVLIPLTKSAAWWQLAHDERDAIFRGSGRHPGHVGVGLPYARTITRTLYHCRPLPGTGWDFLTYFEFLPERRAEFSALLEGLRDPARNPEWNYVEREFEVWLSRG
ncbi:MAG TPA: hypothetical protein VGQ57_13630 [Polyangiaceae bacterium]|jgi:hypothetical protein|nr:hypothetical protein [Polyangiaceae bacterium]